MTPVYLLKDINSFNGVIESLKNTISKPIEIRVRKYVNKHILRNMYYTSVFPYLNYCSEIWGNACHA